MSWALRVLLIDDDPDDRVLAARALEASLGKIAAVEPIDESGFAEALAGPPFDLVVTDLSGRWIGGLDVLDRAKARWPGVPVILFTGTGSEEAAVTAFKKGLDDYVVKSRAGYERLGMAAAVLLTRVRVETARRASLENYRALVNDIPAGIVEAMPDGRITAANPAWRRMFGFGEADDLGGFNMRSTYADPADRDRALKSIRDGGTLEVELLLRRPDGSNFWAAGHIRGTVGADGTLSALRGVWFDISARKRIELALHETESRLRALADNSPMSIALKGFDGRFLFVNKRFSEWYGKRPEDVLGKTMAEVFPDRRPERMLAQDQELMTSGQPNARTEVVAFADGSLHHLDIVKFLVPGPIPAIGSMLTDVTHQRQVEDQLRQAQKMEAVGQLTGGIAHDFNNLLTVILGTAEILAGALRGDPKLDRLAGMISAAATRGADLTNRLLAFARKQTLQPKVTDINDLVKRSRGLLRRALGEHIEIKVVRGSGVRTATVDPAQLEAAILNLAVNARDAMPGGGKLTIETANVELDRDYARANDGVTPGPYVRISVTDIGTGMAPEILAKAFDPFFTTKEVGKGTGLGLSMVYGFVKQSGGHLKIYSEVGHGTTVNLYLPHSAEIDQAIAAPGEPVEIRGGSETILMVEDDAMVRGHVEGQLADLGYRVLVARNGLEALEFLRQDHKIDLLFTDIVMPGGMNGRQLAEAARHLRPALKVLYTSGYAESAIGGGLDLLGKPYRRRDLAAKLRNVLDA